jgi:hypothetical protein
LPHFAAPGALRFLFQLGRQFDQRIPYDNIEDLTRQPFAFLHFGMKSSGHIGLGSMGKAIFIQIGCLLLIALARLKYCSAAKVAEIMPHCSNALGDALP